jgi:hypothetical protein
MANGDIRNCAFCFDDYVVKHGNRHTECCHTCAIKHSKSKTGKIKSDVKLQDYTQSALKGTRSSIALSTIENIGKLADPLNWKRK